MSSSRPTLAWRVLVLGLFWAPSGFASQTFPEALRQKLDLPQTAGPGPGCQLCHLDDVGGLKTATKPFARSLMRVGLTAANVPSLRSALDALEAQGTDSDRDGAPDIAELEAGEDPNVAAGADPGAADEVPLPRTGCAVSSPHAAEPVPGAVVLLGLAGLALLRRRPKRSGSSPARRLRRS